MKGCHTGKPKFETPILITAFRTGDVITGTPVLLLTVDSHRDYCPLGEIALPVVGKVIGYPMATPNIGDNGVSHTRHLVPGRRRGRPREIAAAISNAAMRAAQPANPDSAMMNTIVSAWEIDLLGFASNS
jgi:hypothetical protein